MTEFDDFGLLADMARRELIHLLEEVSEVKDLVVDPTLMRPLDKIASMSLLQEHNCATVQQLIIGRSLVWSETATRRLYLVRPSKVVAKCIADQICAEPEQHYSVIFMPNRRFICEQEFESSGVAGLIDVYELDFSLISIDSNLFSLENPRMTVSLIVDHTYTELYNVANSLWQLQSLYGLIPTIYGVGEHSVWANNLLKKFYAERGEPRSSPDQPVSHLFLLDRNLDVAAVLLTGLTYESMLHDTFGISCGKVTFGEAVESRMRSNEKSSRGSKITALSNNDPIFSAIRNKHMTAVFPFLSSKAKSLQSSFDRGSHLDEIKEMKQFVSNELKSLRQQHRQLELHICACETVLDNCKGMSDRLTLEHALVSGICEPNDVMNYLEDTMCQQQNQWQVLLLACLWSVTQNGIPSKYYQSFNEQFVRAYGHEYLPALHSLSVQGLLVERTNPQISLASKAVPMSSRISQLSSRPTFQFLSHRLNLIPSSSEGSVDLRAPNQMRYVFSGAFTPALTQIIADTLNNGWNTVEMKRTFGDWVFCDQNSYTPASRPPDSRIRKAILVYFIGGVTYAEIAALTLLGQHNNLRMIVATTNIIHRENFIKEMANVSVVECGAPCRT
ncbi:hypothetical protein AB6A40_002379 [Gnathostoma spinigerum]|uniref:Vacuolar protein sorting-associated protein 33B n=1 Tax=Gnathostoma spinigerum TaxID=75299 RepID=A0ABD6E7J9_9BILA